MKTKRIAMVNDHLGQGGVGATTKRLVPEFVSRGYDVTSITLLKDDVINGIKCVYLGNGKIRRKMIFPVLLRLAKLIQKEKYDFILSNKDPVNVFTIIAHKIAFSKSILLVNSRTNVSKVKEHEVHFLHRISLRLAKYLYKYANYVANVSVGASKESEMFFGVDRVHTLYNAVIKDSDILIAHSQPEHEFYGKDKKVVVSCGRLVHQKNYGFMLRAFARAVREENSLRLIIVGEGPKRSELENLIEELNISAYVSLPGYSSCPQAYMQHADVFWFTSFYEGFGNVLVEALSVGTNVISINCEYGPSEILEDGKYGILIDSWDEEEHAQALISSLQNPMHNKETLKQRALEFSVKACADRYLQLLEKK